MDPIEQIKPVKDTSLAMLLEAQARGYTIHYLELADLFLDDGQALARSRTLIVRDQPQNWFEFVSEQQISLGDMDLILMRKDPPVDPEFI